MTKESSAPFDTIESAQEFMVLLAQVVSESQCALATEIDTQSPHGSPRHQQALQLIAYNLDRLSVHLKRTRRILNDLRMLRRLLLEEKIATAA